MASRWYVLHVYSGYENKVKGRIEALKDIDPLIAERVTSYEIPEEQITVKDSKGNKKDKKKKFFPGYALIEMDLDQSNWKDIVASLKRLDGVTGFVGQQPSKMPVPMSDEEVRAILQRSGQRSSVRVQKSWNMDFQEGEEVRIVDGPFDSFTGTVEEVHQDKGKLRVSVGIFGRNTPVDLTFSQVEKF